MKNQDNAKQPAMPYCVQHGFVDYKKGLTKREMFAMAAMQGIMGNPNAEPVNGIQFRNIAEDAVRAADALLAELERAK